MTTWTINRLSREWVGPITVQADGTPVTGWTYTIVDRYTAPASAAAIDGTPSALDGGLGILVGPGSNHDLEPGEYEIWVRYEAAPEAPVLAAVGRITISRGAGT